MLEEVYGIALIPLIVGLVDLIKKVGLPEKLAPLVSVGIGVGLVFAYGLTEAGWNILQCATVGLALGLAPVGLYSGTKNVSQYFGR